MGNDWYQERNKRTDSFTEVNENCHKVKVSVIVTADIEKYGTQVMFITLLNILSRWCNTINVTCNEGVNLLSPYTPGLGIVTFAKQLLRDIDEQGMFTFNEQGSEIGDIVVYIGRPEANHTVPYISIDGHGWISSCSFNSFGECERHTKSDNPIGPAFAACLGNAELFRWANQMYAGTYAKWYSIYDSTVEDYCISDEIEFPIVDLGRVHLVGCGAIGSSFTYLLRFANLKGTLTFIDADKGVELHNTSSSLLFTPKNQLMRKTKDEICFDHLNGSSYRVNTPFNGDYNDFGYDHSKESKSADIILCFANDHNIWSTIQHLYPPVVFHSTTSRSWGINVGRHIPLKDNCIMCTFQDLIKIKYVPKCAEGEIPNDEQLRIVKEDMNGEQSHASILPFLSPAAAIITMGEVIKLLTGRVSNENTAEFNMSTKDGVFLTDQQGAKNCYICRDQKPEIYSELNIRLQF